MAIATNLNDTQLILLTTASQRDAGNLYPLPTSLSDGGHRIAKAVACLLKLDLVRELPTIVAAQVWRNNDDVRFGLAITDLGRVAIGIDPLVPIDDSAAAGVAKVTMNAVLGGPAKSLNNPSTFRAGTKQALVVDMLSAEAGASLDALVAATGWLPHTTRAAITGLRKRGHAVLTEKRDGACHYRIAAA